MSNKSVSLQKLKSRLAARIYKHLPLDPIAMHARPHVQFSFSAYGEDRIMDAWLKLKGIPSSDIRYLDVGAAYPVFLSNTYAFYRCGGSGILVEPDPVQAAHLRRIRPHDQVVEAGAALSAGHAELIQMSSPVFNTFNTKAANKVVEQSKTWMPDQVQQIKSRVSVPMRTISDLLESFFDNKPLHILSLDVEGMDFELLMAMDLERFRPTLICTEIGAPLEEYSQFLQPFGYNFVCWTPDNYIFVHK